MPWEWLKPGRDGVTISVQVVPRSSQTKVFDLAGDRCKIKIKAPPVDGEANSALIDYLAKLFGVPKRQVVIIQGDRGKKKVVQIGGVALLQAEKLLQQFEGHG